MAKKISSTEQITTAAPEEVAGDGLAADALPPRLGRADVLTIAASRSTQARRAGGIEVLRTRSDAAGAPLDDDAWRRVPRGIAVGLLLAVLFWAALAGLGMWLLR